MNKIADAARKALDVKTVKLDDIVKNYGGIVTINGLSYTSYKDKRIPVFSFVEGNGAVFRGTCTKLNELATELETAYDGNLKEMNDDFKRVGVRVQIGAIISTSTGNKFRPVDRLGEVEFTAEYDDEPETDAETGEVVDKENFNLF